VRPRESTLFWRIFIPNAALLLLAGAVLVLSPAEVDSSPSAGQVAALAIGLGLMVVVNLVLIRRAVVPLERLSAAMRNVDPLQPGQRVQARGTVEIDQLVAVFNEMLERLEEERRQSGRRMLAAQEEERVRLARELHDEVGQAIAGLMLEVDAAARIAPPDVRERLAEARETARDLSSELASIVRRLRPETLDDLGLASALTVLAERFAEQTGIAVRRELDPAAGSIGSDAELAVYRIAQEGLTNVARHAAARHAEISLARRDELVELVIADDGRGMSGSAAGNGRRGMRERAMLLGGTIEFAERAQGGSVIRLRLPVAAEVAK
jgi:two-component system sensor histidine kinase UhpB